MLVAAAGVAGYFLRTDSIAREAAPVEVAERPPPLPPSSPATHSSRERLWIAPDELKSLSMSSSAWEAMLAVAEGDLGQADVADQDSTHDTNTLACALAAAQTGSAELHGKAMDALTSAIGTEEGARWLAIGRNLGSYVIAADVLGVRSGPIYEWLAGFLTRTLTANNTDEQVVADNWSSNRQRLFADGLRHRCTLRLHERVHSPRQLVGGLPALLWRSYEPRRRGVELRHRAAGSVRPRRDPGQGRGQNRLPPRRCNRERHVPGGGDDVCSPTWTQYPWVGLEGAVPAALVFARAGYPAWEVADAAIRRALDYRWFLRQTTGNSDWFDGTRSNECVYLVNRAYGTTFPCSRPVAGGRTIGFSDWTHAPGGAALRGAGGRRS